MQRQGKQYTEPNQPIKVPVPTMPCRHHVTLGKTLEPFLPQSLLAQK